ncbi:MAG: hypothetical protein GYB65_12035, partial [Chloroflexi bacterium]|nr:hypothetical protein [Chloroflexota bacterium]
TQSAATQYALETQQARDTATDEAIASQTAQAAAATAAYWDSLEISGELNDPDGTPLAGITVRIYRADADGDFNPVGGPGSAPVQTPRPEPPQPTVTLAGPSPDLGTPPPVIEEPTPAPVGPTPGGDGAEGDGGSAPLLGNEMLIGFGTEVSGTLETPGQTDAWTFSVAPSTSIRITADPAPGSSADIRLTLLGPDGQPVASSSNEDDSPSATIDETFLNLGGRYTILVSMEPDTNGEYVLLLESVGLTPNSTPDSPFDQPLPTLDPDAEVAPDEGDGPVLFPSPTPADESAAPVEGDDVIPFPPPATPTIDGAAFDTLNVPPVAGGVPFGDVEFPAQGDDDDDDATPVPSGGDEFVCEVTTNDQGQFVVNPQECGDGLEPGTYNLEIPYDQLPEELRPFDGSSIVIEVTVPDTDGGPIIINIPEPDAPPTPTPTATPITPTATPTIAVTPSPTQADPIALTQTALADILTGTARAREGVSGINTLTPTPGDGMGTPAPEGTLGKTGGIPDIGSDGLDGSNGLAILAIAAAGLVAVVFVARKLRNGNVT